MNLKKLFIALGITAVITGIVFIFVWQKTSNKDKSATSNNPLSAQTQQKGAFPGMLANPLKNNAPSTVGQIPAASKPAVGSTTPGSAKQTSPANQAATKRRMNITSIKSAMNSKVLAGALCRCGGGIVQSGSGNDPLCVGGLNANNPALKWPKLNICGPSVANARWTVVNGDNDNWNVTVTCTNVKDCNGPTNAICNAQGCTFQGTCK